MSFDKIKHIKNMQSSVDKFIQYLKKQGIEFIEQDNELDNKGQNLENIILKEKDKSIKISWHSFYRFSGIACIYKDVGENRIETVLVTNDMWYDIFMKQIIVKLFEEYGK